MPRAVRLQSPLSMSAAPSASNPPELREPKVRAEEEIPESMIADSEVGGGEMETDEEEAEESGRVHGAKLSFRERIEEFIGRLSTRNNFWHRVCSLIWLPYAFKSGIRMKRVDADTFTAELPYRRFNKNWYNAMAGAALLANSEIAGGMYIFGICGGEYTVVCKHLEYKFMRPCFGPAVYKITPKEDIQQLIATGKEFNITLELDIVQQSMLPERVRPAAERVLPKSVGSKVAAKEKRVGKATATFHVTPKAHQQSKGRTVR